MIMYNPWHGCHKISEGCRNCYMYYLDRQHGIETPSNRVVKNKSGFLLPVERKKDGSFKIPPGTKVNLCRTSDFMVEDADPWREQVWSMMKYRSDLLWDVLTKRPERLKTCLPNDWNDGYSNVILGITAENQEAADRRIPVLVNTPAKHKYVNCAPFIGGITLPHDLTGIEQIGCGGENYDGCRICKEEWVASLSRQCLERQISFCFYETGTCYEKDGIMYKIKDKRTQSEQAHLSGLSHNAGKPIKYDLKNIDGTPLSQAKPVFYGKNCPACGNRPMCAGCAACGKCLTKTGGIRP